MSNTKKPANKSKFSLKMHLIFVVKYRKKLLSDNRIDTIVKNKIRTLETRDFCVDTMESDKDHLHMMIDYSPNVSVASIVRSLKQGTAVELWRHSDLTTHFWKEHTFWSDGYFVCSIGDASEETIRKYIDNQG